MPLHPEVLQAFLCNPPKSQCQHNRPSLFQQVRAEGSDRYLFSHLCSSCSLCFQSKDIGIQMHEELVKVTNELYTVSNAPCVLQIDPSHLISSLSSSTPFFCLSEVLFHALFILSYHLSFCFVHSERLVLSSLSTSFLGSFGK